MKTKEGDIYQMVTDLIISKLESGVIPWQKKWSGGEAPRNYITKKAYRGINALLTSLVPFESIYFLSFKQVQELGGTVKKGERATPVVYWNFTIQHRKTKAKISNSYYKELSTAQQAEYEIFSFIKYYNVFNIEQTTLEVPAQEKIEQTENEIISNCMEIIMNMPLCPPIAHKGPQAYYSPSQDYVNMPLLNSFDDSESYYHVLFHELVHSTGHTTRLNREEITKNAAFGSQTYSKEELTADLGASFLCGVAGILDKTIDNSAAYIQGWLKSLRNDKKFVFEASSKAQKAADYILNTSFIHEEE